MNQERVDSLRSYIKEDPAEPFNRYALALELAHDEMDEAISILLELLKDTPSYIPTYYQAASLLIEQNRIEEAKIVLERGVIICRQSNEHKTLRELKSLAEELD